MTIVPEKIAELKSIKTLLLNNNKILMPPEEVGHLPRLESLSLEHNQLTVLPSSIAMLSPTLLFLNLSHNPLAMLSPAISCLENLKSLWLGYTGLLCFPDQICSLHNLTRLSLEGNHILQIECGIRIRNLQQLNWVSLAKNTLKSVGDSFCSLPCLHMLNLSNNQLTEIPHITHSPALINLNLRNNKVSSLPENRLNRKVCLDLRDNPITAKDIGALKNVSRCHRNEGNCLDKN